MPAFWSKFFVWGTFISIVHSHDRKPIIKSMFGRVIIEISPSTCGKITPLCGIRDLRNRCSITVRFHSGILNGPNLLAVSKVIIRVVINICDGLCYFKVSNHPIVSNIHNRLQASSLKLSLKLFGRSRH